MWERVEKLLVVIIKKRGMKVKVIFIGTQKAILEWRSIQFATNFGKSASETFFFHIQWRKK